MTTRFALRPRRVAPVFAGYMGLAVTGHWLAGPAHIWPVAAAMMVLMTVTYPVEAWLKGQHLPLEAGIALGLSALAVFGALTSPVLIIAAIFAHAALDLIKGRGLGVPFYPTYLFGCAAFDVAYGAALLAYFIQTGGLG